MELCLGERSNKITEKYENLNSSSKSRTIVGKENKKKMC